MWSHYITTERLQNTNSKTSLSLQQVETPLNSPSPPSKGCSSLEYCFENGRRSLNPLLAHVVHSTVKYPVHRPGTWSCRSFGEQLAFLRLDAVWSRQDHRLCDWKFWNVSNSVYCDKSTRPFFHRGHFRTFVGKLARFFSFLKRRLYSQFRSSGSFS